MSDKEIPTRRNGDWPQTKVNQRIAVAVPELLALGERDALFAVQLAIRNGEDPEAYIHRTLREKHGLDELWMTEG